MWQRLFTRECVDYRSLDGRRVAEAIEARARIIILGDEKERIATRIFLHRDFLADYTD